MAFIPWECLLPVPVNGFHQNIPDVIAISANQSETSENLAGSYVNISFYFYAVFSYVHLLVFEVFKLNFE